MKTNIYIEIEFKGDEIFSYTDKIDKRFGFLETSEQITQNQQLKKEIDKVYLNILNSYPKCAKIKNIYFNFINDEDIIICSIIYKKINRNDFTHKSEYIDWIVQGYKLKITQDKGGYGNG